MNILQPIDIQGNQRGENGVTVTWAVPQLQKQFSDVIDYYVITCVGEKNTKVLYVEAKDLSEQAETNVTSTCSYFGFDKDEMKEVKLEFVTKLGGGLSSKASFVG